MLPTCSTAYSRRGSARVEVTVVRALSPLAYGWSDNCDCCGDAGVATSAAAARNDATISAKVPTADPFGSSFYLLLKKDLSQLVFLARLENGEHLVAGPQLG